jgi:hypothetical protein
MSNETEEARQRGVVWASDLVSSSVLPEDLGFIEYLMSKVRINLTEERGAEFARIFCEAAREVIVEAEGRL